MESSALSREYRTRTGVDVVYYSQLRVQNQDQELMESSTLS